MNNHPQRETAGGKPVRPGPDNGKLDTLAKPGDINAVGPATYTGDADVQEISREAAERSLPPDPDPDDPVLP